MAVPHHAHDPHREHYLILFATVVAIVATKLADPILEWQIGFAKNLLALNFLANILIKGIVLILLVAMVMVVVKWLFELLPFMEK